MEKILESKGEQREGDVRAAIGEWTRKDARGATDWYNRNSGRMSPENKTVIATTFSDIALDSLEFDGAKQWVEQIGDPAKRAELLKKIDDKFEEIRLHQEKQKAGNG